MTDDSAINRESLIGVWRWESPEVDGDRFIEIIQFCDDHTYVFDLYNAEKHQCRCWYYYEIRSCEEMIKIPLGSYIVNKVRAPESVPLRMEEGQLFMNGYALTRIEDQPVPERLNLLVMRRTLGDGTEETKILKHKLIPMEEILPLLHSSE